jgi:hypothetical protein
MAKATAVALTLAAVLALLLVRDQTLAAEDKKPAPAAPFAGKVIVVTQSTHDSRGMVLQDAQVRQLGGKAFLVGKGATIVEAGYNTDRATWVAVDAIVNIVEFKSIEELRRAYQDPRHAK